MADRDVDEVSMGRSLHAAHQLFPSEWYHQFLLLPCSRLHRGFQFLEVSYHSFLSMEALCETHYTPRCPDSTVQFVGISAFHTQIADPLIGGTYMTVRPQ